MDSRGEKTGRKCRYGDDETAIYCLKNTEIEDELIYGKKDLMYTAKVLHVLSRKYDNALIVVDVCGLLAVMGNLFDFIGLRACNSFYK